MNTAEARLINFINDKYPELENRAFISEEFRLSLTDRDIQILGSIFRGMTNIEDDNLKYIIDDETLIITPRLFNKINNIPNDLSHGYSLIYHRDSKDILLIPYEVTVKLTRNTIVSLTLKEHDSRLVFITLEDNSLDVDIIDTDRHYIINGKLYERIHLNTKGIPEVIVNDYLSLQNFKEVRGFSCDLEGINSVLSLYIQIKYIFKCFNYKEFNRAYSEWIEENPLLLSSWTISPIANRFIVYGEENIDLFWAGYLVACECIKYSLIKSIYVRDNEVMECIRRFTQDTNHESFEFYSKLFDKFGYGKIVDIVVALLHSMNY